MLRNPTKNQLMTEQKIEIDAQLFKKLEH